MTLHRTPEDRAKIADLRKQVRKLEEPHKKAQRQALKVARAERVKAVGKPVQGQRQPRQRDNSYLAWIRRLPCVACGATRGVEAAHIRAGYLSDGWRPTGMMEKPDDWRTAPLCAFDHRDGPDAQHKSNERAWWERRGVYPPILCAALRQAYERGADGAAVINILRRAP